jgi:hypothetical protein
MVLLTNAIFTCSFVLFAYFLLTAKTRRQVLALTVAGALALTLVAPPKAQAQASLVVIIESVLNVIKGAIQTALTSINTVRAANSTLHQQVAWPMTLINQAKGLVTQMTAQYRTPMTNLFNIDLRSATLPNPTALENVVRNHQISDFAGLAAAYTKAYGSVPAQTAASPRDRMMSDMDDALALDNLKTLKQTDAADDLTLQEANSLENGAGQAAPGSAPFLTAAAVAASIQCQALTQKMLAAELRQEAARLAHSNALLKRGAGMTSDVNTQILNLLQNH